MKNKYQIELENRGYDVIITEDEIKVVNRNYEKQYVSFNRKNCLYTAMEFGSEISFATCPIYDIWRKLILSVHYNEEEE